MRGRRETWLFLAFSFIFPFLLRYILPPPFFEAQKRSWFEPHLGHCEEEHTKAE